MMKKKKIGISIIILISMIMLGSGNVKAALQSNPNTHMTKEDSLTETLQSDLTPNTSNGIDVHQMRTTEYGAMAILAASGYGNPSNAKVITTTTGNNTGVMLSTGEYEWTSGIATTNTLSGVNARYYDLYTTNGNSAKPGDALGSKTVANPGCAGWHQAYSSGWIGSTHGFVRGGSGGLFSFDYYGPDYDVLGRAVAVCGAGL